MFRPKLQERYYQVFGISSRDPYGEIGPRHERLLRAAPKKFIDQPDEAETGESAGRSDVVAAIPESPKHRECQYDQQFQPSGSRRD
ncbi:e3 binding domain protein [Lasius niger]|uniref:E3 binding domain protein n=1 Tax=Lasius niger TaxID=67767 RepID=A0A0J7NDD3_LASNI|nr:e3 binding domain protein [Lasius niger]